MVRLSYRRQRKGELYDAGLVTKIQLIYLFAALAWIFLIYFLGLFETGIVGWFFIILPLAVYAINFMGVTNCNPDVENELFKGNFISFGFLIAIIVLNWNKANIRHKERFFRLIVVALILLMLSLIDFWVDRPNRSIINSLRTIFQTAAVALFGWALYIYYLDQTVKSEACPQPAEGS